MHRRPRVILDSDRDPLRTARAVVARMLPRPLRSCTGVRPTSDNRHACDKHGDFRRMSNCEVSSTYLDRHAVQLPCMPGATLTQVGARVWDTLDELRSLKNNVSLGTQAAAARALVDTAKLALAVSGQCPLASMSLDEAVQGEYAANVGVLEAGLAALAEEAATWAWNLAPASVVGSRDIGVIARDVRDAAAASRATAEYRRAVWAGQYDTLPAVGSGVADGGGSTSAGSV